MQGGLVWHSRWGRGAQGAFRGVWPRGSAPEPSAHGPSLRLHLAPAEHKPAEHVHMRAPGKPQEQQTWTAAPRRGLEGAELPLGQGSAQQGAKHSLSLLSKLSGHSGGQGWGWTAAESLPTGPPALCGSAASPRLQPCHDMRSGPRGGAQPSGVTATAQRERLLSVLPGGDRPRASPGRAQREEGCTPAWLWPASAETHAQL